MSFRAWWQHVCNGSFWFIIGFVYMELLCRFRSLTCWWTPTPLNAYYIFLIVWSVTVNYASPTDERSDKLCNTMLRKKEYFNSSEVFIPVEANSSTMCWRPMEMQCIRHSDVCRSTHCTRGWAPSAGVHTPLQPAWNTANCFRKTEHSRLQYWSKARSFLLSVQNKCKNSDS